MGVFPASSSTVAVLDGAPSAPPLSSEPVIVDLGSNSARVVVVDHPIPGVLETIAEERDLRLATELANAFARGRRRSPSTSSPPPPFGPQPRRALATERSIDWTPPRTAHRRRAIPPRPPASRKPSLKAAASYPMAKPRAPTSAPWTERAVAWAPSSRDTPPTASAPGAPTPSSVGDRRDDAARPSPPVACARAWRSPPSRARPWRRLHQRRRHRRHPCPRSRGRGAPSETCFDHTMLARIAAILHFSDGDKDGARPFLSLLPAAEKRHLRRCGALLA